MPAGTLTLELHDSRTVDDCSSAVSPLPKLFSYSCLNEGRHWTYTRIAYDASTEKIHFSQFLVLTKKVIFEYSCTFYLIGKETQRGLPSAESLPKCVRRLGLGQAKACSQELQSRSSMRAAGIQGIHLLAGAQSIWPMDHGKSTKSHSLTLPGQPLGRLRIQ